MIERTHPAPDGTVGAALWSECGAYRYALTRTWNAGGPRLLVVMLNPSTATEARNDPTVARCERRARASGFGAVRVVNLFAFCATDPRALVRAADPVGPGNDTVIRASVSDWAGGAADLILCAWGSHGRHLGRAGAVADLVAEAGRPLWCLGTTRAGQPRHPLYVANATKPERWFAPAATAVVSLTTS